MDPPKKNRRGPYGKDNKPTDTDDSKGLENFNVHDAVDNVNVACIGEDANYSAQINNTPNDACIVTESDMQRLMDLAIYCEGTFCYGDGAYCCISDSSQCCWHETTYVYELWWFWFIWFIIFLFFATCLICIRRRRLANRQYIRVGQPEYGTTTVITGHVPPAQYPQPAYPAQQPSYPAQPPTAPTQYPQQPVPPPTYEHAQKSAPPPYQ